MPATKLNKQNSSLKVMHTPRSVDLDITNKCNLRCGYCYHFSSPGDVARDLPTDEWLRFFEELGRCNVMNLTLAGGEPFLRKDLKELIQGIVKNKMRFSILSNGTLIDDEIAGFLSKTGRCDNVQVSLDGSTQETHDPLRGKGCFEKAVAGIRCLQRHHLSIDVRVTIHKYNLSDLVRIAEFLLEEIGLPSFSANAASYMGLCRRNSDQIELEIHERSLAMKTLLGLNETYNNRIVAQSGPLADAREWLKMEHARKKGNEAPPHWGESHRMRMRKGKNRCACRRRYRALHHVKPHRTR
jgi:SynChlorMet cassette radical SAM/SPASM protein ScmE